MKKKNNKLNKIYRALKFVFVFQVFAYLFMIIFSVTIATDRSGIAAEINKQESALSSNEKTFFDKRQDIITSRVSSPSDNNIVSAISKRENLVEYVYDNLDKTAQR